mgnify:CR=1 FL=1
MYSMNPLPFLIVSTVLMAIETLLAKKIMSDGLFPGTIASPGHA